MIKTKRGALALGCAAAMMIAVACGGSAESEKEGAAPEAATAPAPAPPVPQLPANHPPLDQATAESLVQPPPPGSGTGSASLAWTAPANWAVEAPDNPMRKAQYRVGEAVCVVYYFGPRQGGDAETNTRMWADQFVQPDARPSREVMKTEKIEVNGVPVVLAEITGTYGGDGRPAKWNYMLLGAVVEGPDAPWFFKFTGPEEIVRGERENFRAMIESVQPGR